MGAGSGRVVTVIPVGLSVGVRARLVWQFGDASDLFNPVVWLRVAGGGGGEAARRSILRPYFLLVL